MSSDPRSSLPPFGGSIPPVAGPSAGPGQHYEPPRKRRISTVWLVLGILGGVGLFSLLGCVGLAALWWAAERDQPVTAQDRAPVVTAEDLAQFSDFEFKANRETVTKTRSSIDGTIEVECEYDDELNEDAPYLLCSYTVQPNVSDAQTEYLLSKTAVGVGLRLGGAAEVTQQQRNDVFRWGDQSEFCLLKSGPIVVGNTFVARKGKRTFSLFIAGLSFEDGETFGELVEPHLRKLESYEP